MVLNTGRTISLHHARRRKAEAEDLTGVDVSLGRAIQVLDHEGSGPPVHPDRPSGRRRAVQPRQPPQMPGRHLPGSPARDIEAATAERPDPRLEAVEEAIEEGLAIDRAAGGHF